VIWRKEETQALPDGAESELAKIGGRVAATPERLEIPWQPYPSTSAERVWTWMVVVVDSAAERGAADGARK
jgi:hypothetical protein